MHQTLVIVFSLLIFLSGCSASTGAFVKNKLSNQQLKHALYQQHKEWQGVKYRMGGTTRRGIDCSGFVYRTFKDKAGVNLPRSTELQSTLGKEINSDELRQGDLVFFKTGTVFKSRHVGIYLGNGKFLHASTSRGVMISKLNNPYWKDNYWQSRRILQ